MSLLLLILVRVEALSQQAGSVRALALLMQLPLQLLVLAGVQVLQLELASPLRVPSCSLLSL